MVTSLRTKPTNSTPITCQLESACQLFNWGSQTQITKSQLSTIKVGNAFLLNIDQSSLKTNSVIEITGSASKAFWFVVEATAQKTSSGSLAPVAPVGLISRSELKNKYKSFFSTQGPDTEAIRAVRYYNSLEQSRKNRGRVDHKGFLVFEWGKDKDKAPFLKTPQIMQKLINTFLKVFKIKRTVLKMTQNF